MTELEAELEHRMLKPGIEDAEVQETRRLINEVSARLEVRALRQNGAQRASSVGQS